VADDPGDGHPAPRVTVSLVTFQGMRWLPGCLESLRRQTLADYELLVVDNASTDGTVERLRAASATDARIDVHESPVNLGFARAHNRNILRARGRYVCLLNQDVELDDTFLHETVAAFGAGVRIGAVQARLRRLGQDGSRTRILDGTGLEMHRDRRVVSRSQGEPDGPEHLRPGPVWGVDGPAPVYRREALLDARVPRRGGGWEVLDEDFFMYKEDVDLAWRLRRLGWRAWYAPRAVAWHARGAGGERAVTLLEIARTNRTIPRWVKALSWRNQRLMQVKNDRFSDFVRDLPWIARREVLSLGFMIVADPRRLRAVPALVAAFPGAVRKRAYLGRHASRRRDPVVEGVP
jgi:GT2 family glycosyltransferase